MLLGIDTSGAVSVAVARADLSAGTVEVMAVRSDERARHHDEVLLALVDETLAAAGGTRADIEGVVAGRGPGPFTGLRVGLVAARTIAAVLGVPLYAVCSLDALALQALDAAADEEAAGERADEETAGAAQGRAEESAGAALPQTIAVALDARRREVYWARYTVRDAVPVPVAGPAVDAPADVAAALTAAHALVGSGCSLYPQLLPATAAIDHVDAGALIRVAVARLAAGEDLSDSEPLYLREPDAAKPTARKSALGR